MTVSTESDPSSPSARERSAIGRFQFFVTRHAHVRDAHVARGADLSAQDSDQCSVLCASRVDAEALDRLVRVMDEAFDGAELRAPVNPWAAVAERLRDDIRGKLVHRYKGPHATIAQRTLTLRWTRDDVMNPLAAECAKLLATAIVWQGDDEDTERAEDETFTAAIRPTLADLRARRRAEQEWPEE